MPSIDGARGYETAGNIYLIRARQKAVSTCPQWPVTPTNSPLPSSGFMLTSRGLLQPFLAASSSACSRGRESS